MASAHSHSHSCGHEHSALEAARPPRERTAAERQTQQTGEALEPIHAAIIAGLIGATASGAVIPLSSVTAVRRAVAVRFSTRGDQFADQLEQLVFEGADIGRGTAVRRYNLTVSPTFGPNRNGSITDLPRSNLVRRELERMADRARREVTPRMARDIAESIYEASEAGLSREEIAEQLRTNTFPRARTIEARRIVHTELTAAANRGAIAAYDEAGAAQKTWMAQFDGRTRRTHRTADGQSVGIGEFFRVGGHRAAYPGDPRLPASERVNCRCWPAMG